ncbi:MAG TPA: hypothetical protein VLF18_03395 [Tahibacter sp.]|uniref:hypothetical protein n=1 Tax=Tahibacter sp. TaxID=2056211 RepID=UPI002C1CB670|nr:hypothetical protein [Tahibacter sp.]HSX59225.1 hypothetical protein [Tahibacter sp.]
MSTTLRLVIALRRDQHARGDRLDRELRAIPGVTVLGAFRGRVQATADEAALAEIRRRVGDIAEVEVEERRGLPD